MTYTNVRIHYQTAVMLYMRACQLAEMVEGDESGLAGSVRNILEDLGPFLAKRAENAAWAQWEDALANLPDKHREPVKQAFERWKQLQGLDPRFGHEELVWATRPRDGK